MANSVRQPSDTSGCWIRLLCVLLLVFSTVCSANDEQALAVAEQRIRESLSEFMAHSTSPKIHSSFSLTHERPPQGGGIVAEMERFIYLIIQDSNQLQSDYIADLESAGWFQFYDYERLWADTEFKQSRKIIRDARAAVGRYEDDYWALFDIALDRIQDMRVSATEQLFFERSFQLGIEQGRSTGDRYIELEFSYLTVAGDIVDYLQNINGQWAVELNQMYFENEKLANKFNFFLDRIDGIYADQAEIDSRRMEMIDTMFLFD
ncbi:MAG: hypothetical protein AAGH65_10780 [Pseudomonadota bacterium]